MRSHRASGGIAVRRPDRQAGFTLLELVIALTLFSVFLGVLSPLVSNWISDRKKSETVRRLADLKQAFKAGYAKYAMEIDAEPDARIMIDGVQMLVNGATVTDAMLDWTRAFSSSSLRVLAHDGYNLPWRVLIAPRFVTEVSGVPIHHHKLAFVSVGSNGVLEPGTSFDAATGRLVTAGDDTGEVVDGFQVQSALFERSRKRVEELSKLYGGYFYTRFTSTEARNVNVNYFVNAARAGADVSNFDTAGAVANTGGEFVPAGPLLTSFGLAPLDFKDGYGNDILLDNSSDAVRSPDNANPAMQAPPYTAMFRVNLPGGAVYSHAVIGTN